MNEVVQKLLKVQDRWTCLDHQGPMHTVEEKQGAHLIEERYTTNTT